VTRVLCLGGVVVDRVYTVDRLPSGGGKTLVRDARVGGGGIAATAACAIVALGGEALWIGPVGDDDAGSQALRLLEIRGVDISGAQVAPGLPTPIATALVDLHGERHLIVHRSPALDVTPVRLPDFDAVMVDHRHPAAAQAALSEGRSRGLPAVLDADDGSPDHVRVLVGAAGHVVFSRSALTSFTGGDDPAAALEAAAHAGVAPDTVLGVTLGERGSLFRVSGATIEIGTPRVRARDTTGCGDVFHGAYALALAECRAVTEAARFAAAAAALKAQAGRGWDGMPGRPAVEELMEGDW